MSQEKSPDRKTSPNQAGRRTPPLSIPLPFEKALDGLLGVDPKQLPKTPKKPPAKKAAAKKK